MSRTLGIGLVVALSCGFTEAMAGQRVPVLPRGYAYPRSPKVEIKPGDTHPQPLRFDDKYGVYHHVKLDPTTPQWSHKLLRIEAGRPEPWRPDTVYALFPQGFKGYDKIASVILARKLILFGRKYDMTGAVSLRSTNHPEYALQRYGDLMVVTRAGDRRWIFESVDGGETWRMAGIDYPRYGGRRVELVYDNECVVALRYPDGSEARLVYNIHGFPTKIVTPFGERVILKRGADQLIRTVTVYNVDDPRQPPLPMELSVKFRTLVIVRRFLPLV